MVLDPNGDGAGVDAPNGGAAPEVENGEEPKEVPNEEGAFVIVVASINPPPNGDGEGACTLPPNGDGLVEVKVFPIVVLPAPNGDAPVFEGA